VRVASRRLPSRNHGVRVSCVSTASEFRIRRHCGCGFGESSGWDRLGEDRAVRDQAGKVFVPRLFPACGGLLAHQPDGALGRVDGGAGEAVQQLSGAEPVVTVPVGGIEE
jgi:hypothetical protein